MYFGKKLSLSAAALLCAVSLLSGCGGTAAEKGNSALKNNKSSSSSYSSPSVGSSSSAVSSSSASGSSSASSASSQSSSSASSQSASSVSSQSSLSASSQSSSSTKSSSSEPSSSSTYTPPVITQDREPQIEVTPKPALEIPSSAPIEIPSLSDALSRFSEISEKEPEGTPEEIVKTLLERNILCFAAMQGKCWTNDEKYENDRYYMRGIAPIKSDHLTSAGQIDDLFFGTYTKEKTNYLIHYYDGESIIDTFTDAWGGGLIVDFSMLPTVAEDSFGTTTYAAVISSSKNEIVFGRYNSPTPSQNSAQPNNYHFKAVKENGKWRLENYIVDAPAYEQQYTSLITTNRIGAPDIVELAKQEVGNFGGEPYWGWYGFDYHIEWCAAFVSWCYNEAGQNGPFFVACNSEGIAWFKEVGQWAEADYRDIAPGDAIFFDWDLNGKANHVGLVIGTDGEKVYTIEGNRSDSCRAFAYDLDDDRIFGYGLMRWE